MCGCLPKKRKYNIFFADNSADNSGATCNCNSCSICKKPQDSLVVALSTATLPIVCKAAVSEPNSDTVRSRVVTRKERAAFKDGLLMISDEFYKSTCFNFTIGYATIDFEAINKICKRLSHIFKTYDISDLVHCPKLRHEILIMVQDFFEDITVPEYSSIREGQCATPPSSLEQYMKVEKDYTLFLVKDNENADNNLKEDEDRTIQTNLISLLGDCDIYDLA
jgi:hypothetical protein